MSSRPTSGLDRGWHVGAGLSAFARTNSGALRRDLAGALAEAGRPALLHSSGLAPPAQLWYGGAVLLTNLSTYSSVAVRSPDRCAVFRMMYDLEIWGLVSRPARRLVPPASTKPPTADGNR